jgi:hypothetical protein
MVKTTAFDPADYLDTPEATRAFRHCLGRQGFSDAA